MCELLQYHLKADCDKLELYTVKPKAIPKLIPQRVITNKSEKGIKWSYKKYPIQK